MAAKSKKSVAEPPPVRLVPLNGSLDRADRDGTIEGWCWSPDEPDVHRMLAVLADGGVIAEVQCDQERDDLRAAGIGDGFHSFLLCLEPETMQPGASVEVTLRDTATGQPVGTPQRVTWAGAAAQPPVTPEPAAVPELPALHGHLDRVSRDGWVSGWCWYPDLPGSHVELTVLVDHQIAGSFTAANFRPDLQQAGIGDGTHGFSYALPYSALADKGTLVVAVRESGTGRNLSDPITVRLGRLAGVEDRIVDLERQLRLMGGRVEELSRAAQARDEDRAARALFATVAGFFQELAGAPQGASLRSLGAAGLAGALDEIAARLAPLTLALPDQPKATICIAATAGVDAIHRCLLALHEAGIDATADVVLLDDGGHGGEAALLPSVVRNLRYVRLHDASGLVAGRNTVAQAARGDAVVFLAPEAHLTAGWLDEILACFAREPKAAIAAGRLLREDGLLEAFGLLAGADGLLRDPGDLAPAEAREFGFMRPVDAVAGLAFAIRRSDLQAAGGFSPLYRRFGLAVADLCARLRAAGRSVLVQPLATAVWVERAPASADGAAPDLSLPDEETLRLREQLRAEGWPPGPAAAGFIGHALVIDDGLPRTDRDAGSIATFEQMLVLRRLGYRVTICPVHAGALDPAEVDGLRRQGIDVADGSVTAYLEAEGSTLDLVHVYRYANMAMLLDRIRTLAPHAKLVFATADLHFLREQRRAELAGAPPPDAVRDDELRCIRAADASIVTSDYEMDVLSREPELGRLVLLRWIVRPAPVSAGFAQRRDLCFIGNFRHPPNVDGVLWFAAEVLPLVRAELPGVRLRLAGSYMPAQVQALASDGIEVLGWVEDLAALFASVRLSVAPLRYGAGFKGKVATSLAHGLPVAGSSISLEGTGLHDGDGVLVADDPADFAGAIVRLHQDAALWQHMSERAQERVTTLYSPQAADAVWRGMLTELDCPVRG